SSTLQLVCRGGYYVRSLARDLGRATSALGHLTKLRRTAIGPWEDPAQRTHLKGLELYPWCASREVTEKELARLRARQGIERGAITPPSWTLPDGFPDPEAPIRGISRGIIVAMLRERGGLLFAAPVLRGPL